MPLLLHTYSLSHHLPFVLTALNTVQSSEKNAFIAPDVAKVVIGRHDSPDKTHKTLTQQAKHQCSTKFISTRLLHSGVQTLGCPTMKSEPRSTFLQHIKYCLALANIKPASKHTFLVDYLEPVQHFLTECPRRRKCLLLLRNSKKSFSHSTQSWIYLLENKTLPP